MTALYAILAIICIGGVDWAGGCPQGRQEGEINGEIMAR